MPLNPAIWHFHRELDAGRYLDFFDTGISNSLTLFAPRRKGKTALLLHDIRPLARDRDYNVIYCTFWDNKDKPAKALLTAIEQAREPVTITQRMKAILKRPVKGLAVSVADLKLNLNLDDKAQEQDILQLLAKAFHDIARDKKRTLFLLDEIQHLATRKEFGALVATLRSAFDKYPEKLCALYTGSSRDGLHRLFREQRSPLFNAAQEYPLPDMGSDFVSFICDRFEEAAGRKINLNKAIRVWHKIEMSPYHFIAVIERMLTNIESNIKHSAQAYLKDLDNDPAILTMLSNLKAIDQAVLCQIKQGETSIFGHQALTEIATRLGLDNVSRSGVQGAIRRLRTDGLVYKNAEGEYGIEMAEIIPLLQCG